MVMVLRQCRGVRGNLAELKCSTVLVKFRVLCVGFEVARS